jgi:alanine dehydrogenase
VAIIISEKDLAPLLGAAVHMDGLIGLIEESMRAQSSAANGGLARVETSLLDAKKKFRIMTAAVPGAGQGMRVSALFRGAKDAYFVLLFGADSGDLLALVAGRNLNVWRTGAPAGVACRHLAPAGADQLGLVGSGRQARGQIAAIARALPSVKKVTVFSSTDAHRKSFAREMSAWLGIDVVAASSARNAVENMPIVSLATSSRSQIIEPQWITPGALVVSITSGQLPRETVAGARVIVSWTEEVLGGEAPRQPYMAMIADGSWSASQIAGELGDVIVGKVPARLNPKDTVVFESVGMPIWDTVTTAWAYRWAAANGIGTKFELEP